ncbi:hypothetical protein JNK13_05400 [bacterium]|nr:hypothetical protein [bacterium]
MWIILLIVIAVAALCAWWAIINAKELAKANSELKTLRANSAAQTDPLATQITAMQEQATIDAAERDTLRQKLANAEALLKQKTELASTAQETSKQTGFQLKNAQDALKLAQQQIDALQKEVATLQAKCDPTLLDQLKAAQAELETTLKQVEALNKDKERLQKAIEEGQAKVADLEKSNAGLRKYLLWFQRLWASLGDYPKAFGGTDKELGAWDTVEEADVQALCNRVVAFHKVAILLAGVIDNIARQVGDNFPTAVQIVSGKDDARNRLKDLIAKLQLRQEDKPAEAEQGK